MTTIDISPTYFLDKILKKAAIVPIALYYYSKALTITLVELVLCSWKEADWAAKVVDGQGQN